MASSAADEVRNALPPVTCGSHLNKNQSPGDSWLVLIERDEQADVSTLFEAQKTVSGMLSDSVQLKRQLV